MTTSPRADRTQSAETWPGVRCHSCSGYGFTRYHKGRPVPCLKCRGTGWIGNRPAALDYGTYLATRDEPPAAP